MQHRDANGILMIRGSVPMSLFGFGLVLSLAAGPLVIVSYVSTAIRGVYEGEKLPANWRLMLGVVGGLYALRVLAGIAVAYYFFKRRSIARWLIVGLLTAVIILEVGEAAWRLALGNDDAEYVAEVVSPVVPFCLVATAWMIYFLRSKRVRETLAYPLGKEPTDESPQLAPMV